MKKKLENNKSFFLKGNNETGILLLHGWTCYTNELFPLAEYLNSLGYTVTAPLLRGHGTKPEDLLGVTWRDWLADARQAMNELKKHTPKIFVGGISMGGNLAMLLAEDEGVAGVVPMGAAVRYKFHLEAKISVFFMGLWKTYRHKYYPWWVRKIALERNVYQYYPVMSAREVIRLAEATREFLPRVTKPILIMQSDTDHMVSKKSPLIIFNGVKSKIKEIFWVKDVYHVFILEEKAWEKMGEFIDSVIASVAKQSRDF